MQDICSIKGSKHHLARRQAWQTPSHEWGVGGGREGRKGGGRGQHHGGTLSSGWQVQHASAAAALHDGCKASFWVMSCMFSLCFLKQ